MPPHRRNGQLLTLVHRVSGGRRSVPFQRPVVAHGAVYAATWRQDLIKLDWTTLERQWTIPSEDFHPWFAFRDLVVLDSFATANIRAIRSNGEIAWTLEPRRRWGWTRWRERLVSLDLEEGTALADLTTGTITAHLDFQPRANEVASTVLGDVLLSRDALGDPYRAYDLARQQFLWDRPLLAEMAHAFPFVNEGFTMLRAAGAGRFVAARTNGVCGMSLEDGRVLWGARGRAEAVDVDRGRVYVCGLADRASGSRLTCLDEATGARVYDVPVQALQVWPTAAFQIDSSRTRRDRGYIGVFQISDGALVWSHAHKQETTNAPVIAGNRLFVPAGDGSLLVFEGDIE